MRRALLLFVVACSVSWAGARLAMAASYGGELESVNPQAGRFTMQVLSTEETKSFKTAGLVIVTLDGKRSTLDALAPGMRVSVLTDKAGDVVRVSARSESSATSRPTARPAPQPRPSSSPSPPAARANAGNAGAGWHQFGGAGRNGQSQETGLLKSWPAEGPELLWTARGLGAGYSSVSVAGDLVYTLGSQGEDENVYALDLQTGQIRWKVRNGDTFQDGRGSGPRSTPTLDGDKLYALGASGDLSCLDARTGRIEWQFNILQQFRASNITWGISESPLIDGEKLICTPGGEGATMVALNKTTGRPVWTSPVPGGGNAAYSSAIVANVGGVRQYINFTSRGLIGVRADDGTPLWGDNSSANGTANCSTPLFVNDHVFSASGYGAGGSLLRLQSSRNGTTATVVYHTDDMKNHHGGMVIVDGYLYGSNDPGILTCLELKSGRIAWQNRSVGKGSIAYADGCLYLRSENGPVALIEATPREYRELGRFSPPERSSLNSWPHPVIADGKLFLRDQDILQCYNLRASAE